MEAPIQVIVKLEDTTEILGHLDFSAECDDQKMDWHRNTMSRPVVVPDMDEVPDQRKEKYCLACLIDTDEVCEIVIGDNLW